MNSGTHSRQPGADASAANAAPAAGAITRAMALGAGLGKRMRPITTTTPKPLVSVGGAALIDRLLARFAAVGVNDVVVNVHYLADLMETHIERRKGAPRVTISDERAQLLETGGGVNKALPLLGEAPFFVANTDSMWIEGPRSNLARMIEAWDPERMDALLLLASGPASTGFDGPGDFTMDQDGRLKRRTERQVAPFIYAGVAILKRRLFEGAPEGPFSLNMQFDKALAEDRLYGLRLDGHWLHVGTPEGLRAAEEVIARSHR